MDPVDQMKQPFGGQELDPKSTGTHFGLRQGPDNCVAPTCWKQGIAVTKHENLTMRPPCAGIHMMRPAFLAC